MEVAECHAASKPDIDRFERVFIQDIEGLEPG